MAGVECRFQEGLLRPIWSRHVDADHLADLSGMWIDRVHDHDPPRRVVLAWTAPQPEFGEQEGTAYNGGCTCYHPLFVLSD